MSRTRPGPARRSSGPVILTPIEYNSQRSALDINAAKRPSHHHDGAQRPSIVRTVCSNQMHKLRAR
jgi:hypothetical protein